MLTLERETVCEIRTRHTQRRASAFEPPTERNTQNDDRMSVRELIEHAVEAEISRRNTFFSQFLAAVVANVDGHSARFFEDTMRCNADPEQIAVAVRASWQAFVEERYLLLINGRRMVSLDQLVRVDGLSSIRFVPKVQLRGA